MLITTSKAPDATTSSARAVPNAAPASTASTASEEPRDEVRVRGPVSSGLRALGKAVDVATTGSAVLEAFPKFIYPSVLNATAAEQAQIYSTLDKLPITHVAGVSTVSVVANIPTDKPNWIIFGNARDYGLTSRINLSRETLTTPQGWDDTLTHEVGHTVDYGHKRFPWMPGASGHGPYGHGPHVTDYATTNEKEDYAETYQEYHQRPDNLKDVNPEKYDDQVKNNHQSFMERLVDRKEFRETGKFLGQMMGPNHNTRHAIDSVRAVSGGVQILRGVEQWSASAWNGDSLQHAQGILSTVSGALLLSGVSPLAAVGVQAASTALGQAVKRGDLSGDEVESTVALPVRPLEAVFSRKASPIEEQHRPAKVLAVGLGGAAGGLAGSIAGPYLGVLGGYHLAGGLGGAVGLVAGGVLGFMGGTQLGGRLGGKLADLAS